MPSLTVYRIYQKLLARYGEQNWWPGDSPFEVMVGAVLTQNTSWQNVEKAIYNLKQHKLLTAKRLIEIHHQKLASHLRPVGYFNVKASRLKNFCDWYLVQGGYSKLKRLDSESLRSALLDVNGVGPETADDILLYAFERPVFVIDAYTRRLFGRLGYSEAALAYDDFRRWIEKKLLRVENRVGVFNEYHALIVHHAKHFCKTRPVCDECCLNKICPGRE